MQNKELLLNRIAKHSARIGIVGLGYVGLPLMLRFCEAGFKVIGFDIDTQKVNTLQQGASYIEHIPAALIKEARRQGFEATTNFACAADTDVIILCVPTPLNPYREPDLSFVINTIDALLPYLHLGQLVSLESTTYPGTTEEELKPRIEGLGLTVGQDIFVVFSPEREDPGNSSFNTRTIPKVCGGITANCREVGVALYKAVIDTVIPVSSTRAAEMTKLLENIHRAVNIGLVNEMKIVADRMNIDIHEVIRAAATKPFGFVPYYPGPGLGGHCIPIDPFYLTWKARQYGINTRFIELAGEINATMPDFVIEKISRAFNSRQQSINGSRILIMGLAYKKNVDDMRESPSLVLMEKLQELGADIAYSDPHIPVCPTVRHYHFSLKSIPLNAATLASYDAVVLATDHDAFDYLLVLRSAKLIIDTRGKYLEPADNIVKA